jgi:hypothetical protein
VSRRILPGGAIDLGESLTQAAIREDWWWRQQQTFIGPRLELTLEYHQLAGRRLFLMRPAELLVRASVLQVEVDQASSADAGRVALMQTVTPADVARWMCEELDRTGSFRQAKRCSRD